MIRKFALAIATSACIVTPALAHGAGHQGHQSVHPTAHAIVCTDGESDAELFSRFTVTRHRVVYNGGISDWDRGDSVGFRIDTRPAKTFSFETASTGFADPIVFYSYTTNGTDENTSLDGVTLFVKPNNVTVWTFNIKNATLLPANARITHIWFTDSGFGDFTNTAVNLKVNGLAAAAARGTELDCTSPL